jgi:hypothetical protein
MRNAFILLYLITALMSCDSVEVKKCNDRLNFSINGQIVPSDCDFVGIPNQNDVELLAIADINQKLKIVFLNPDIKNDSDLKIKLGNEVLPYSRTLEYTLANTGIFSLQICIKKDCIIKFLSVTSDPIKQRNKKNRIVTNYIKPIESIKESEDNEISENKKFSKNEDSESIETVDKPTFENAISTMTDIKSGILTSELILNNMKNTYPKLNSNAEYKSLSKEISEITSRINNLFDFNRKRFKIADSQVETKAENLLNDYDNLKVRINSFSDAIAAKPPVESAPVKTPVQTKPTTVSQSDSDFSCNSRGQTGISSADWCFNNEFVTTGSLSIKPSRNIQLTEVAVFGSDIGKVTIRITGNDGTDEKKNASLNGGRSVVSLSDLYVVLKKGNTYTMTATAVRKRDTIDASLGNAQKCSKDSYSDANVSITYNGAVVFANLKYCY